MPDIWLPPHFVADRLGFPFEAGPWTRTRSCWAGGGDLSDEELARFGPRIEWALELAGRLLGCKLEEIRKVNRPGGSCD